MFFRHARKLWPSACTGPNVVEHHQARREPQRHVDRDAQATATSTPITTRDPRPAIAAGSPLIRPNIDVPMMRNERNHDDDPRLPGCRAPSSHQPAGAAAERPRRAVPRRSRRRARAPCTRAACPPRYTGMQQRVDQPADERQASSRTMTITPEDDGDADPRPGALAEETESRTRSTPSPGRRRRAARRRRNRPSRSLRC